MEKARLIYCVLNSLGTEQSNKPEPLCFSAALTFQDSVELFLQVVAENVGANKQQTNIKFMEYWTKINPLLQKKGKGKLSHSVAMER